jgi:hypothetical protein
MAEKHIEWEAVLDSLESGKPIAVGDRDHIDRCGACAQTVEDAREALKLFSESRQLQPSAGSIQRTLALVRSVSSQAGESSQRTRLLKALNELIERISQKLTQSWAELKTDSLQAGAAFRGMDLAAPRMLSYETDRYSITISLQRSDDSRIEKIAGQIAPIDQPNLPAGGVATLENGTILVDCPLSRFGEFEFEDPDGDMDELNILIEGSIIRINLPSISEA